ncbi:MAG TPA: peptidylprolyl isomerase [Solibacterales bacterium]|nr:peptidylprolyl isomerase [Bryobacterales bacterium]
MRHTDYDVAWHRRHSRSPPWDNRISMYLTYLLAVSLLAGAADVSTPPIRVIEEIVAKVNGDIITRGELEQQRRAIEAEIKQQQPNLAGDALANAVRQKQSEALRDKIDQSLLVQRAKELNINVDPDVTRRVAQIQQESKIADVEKFHEWVHQQAGVPFEDFKSEMKNQILTQRVIGQEVASKVNVARSEVTDYYNKHKADFVREETVFLREITIKSADNTPRAWAAAEKKAKDVLARARKGEKFSDLAHQYSDADTAKQDGELGRFKRGDLKPDIEALVFKQSKGYVTDLIKTQGGYEILKVDEKFAAGQASLEDVENEIMEKLYTPRMQPQLRAYLTKLRENAFIEIRGGFVDSGAAPGKDTTWKDPAQLKPETTTKEEVANRKKKRFLGVIPRHSSSVSSSKAAPAIK